MLNQKVILQLPALAKNADSVYDSIVQQTRDAIVSAGYLKVTLGLSGGLDSALVAAIAVDALELEGISSCQVHGLIMPSCWNSKQSLVDAEILSRNLEISTKTLDIMPTYEAISDTLAPAFMGHDKDVTEENIQARIRGLFLMALSNKLDWLVLAPSNKSESVVGYTTLYGDMVGAFAPLAPLYKSWVYELARLRNKRAGFDLIPESILKKAPSAELAPDQTDAATLGPYDDLDALIYELEVLTGGNLDDLSEDCAVESLGQYFDPSYVRRIAGMIKRASYKRLQACPSAVLPRGLDLRDR